MISSAVPPATRGLPIAPTTLQRRAEQQGLQLRRRVGDELVNLRAGRGLSIREVARAASVDRAVLARAETGEGELTIAALARVATALGADASVRLYPAPGVRLRDAIQVRMLDTVIAECHARWRPRLEVPVWRPARGVIDLVLSDERDGDVVSAEAHSEIRRAEQQLRWAAEKTDSLTSTEGWPWIPVVPRICRLLILRSTSANRGLVQALPAMFAAAYPGRTADAVDAIRGSTSRMPEAAIIWVDVRGGASRLLDGPARGVTVGR